MSIEPLSDCCCGCSCWEYVDVWLLRLGAVSPVAFSLVSMAISRALLDRRLLMIAGGGGATMGEYVDEELADASAALI